MTTPPFFFGVDVGGTNIKIGLVDDEGRTLAYKKIATDEHHGPASAMRRVGVELHAMLAEVGLTMAEVASIGLATPGTMDLANGKLLEAHNLPHWFNFPIRQALEEETGATVVLANDANAAAFGEYWLGSGREFHSMVLLTLGTGVGGGIIVNDALIEGDHGFGSECGHIIIDFNDDARAIPTGQRGHLEAYASGTAIVKRTQEAIDAGEKSSIMARMNNGEKLTPLLVAEEAERGDELSLFIVMETARYLGIGVVSLMHTIDPGAVVLGGAVNFGGADSPLGTMFIERVREEVKRRAFPVPGKKTAIRFTSLGANAGYLGACGLARQAYLRDHQTPVTS
ncbi:ROK family protein [Blastopirellula sp. JC732]|uniref:ROK family protein n=1 Tax=Blastopirellula sediminis TaxID=2894196 RepID=A0A9X1MMY0_9BACT|nr:ROK family protein [Blastopirellula sediminis]MCC9607470.1 ROK family protein [Blastopirellula sediminis]MCC9629237.1 ROK family protein [Blastopirellula sediminis]